MYIHYDEPTLYRIYDYELEGYKDVWLTALCDADSYYCDADSYEEEEVENDSYLQSTSR